MTRAIKPWALPLTAMAFVFAVLPTAAASTEPTCTPGTEGCPVVSIGDQPAEAVTATPEAISEIEPRVRQTARERSPHHFASKSYNRWFAELYIKRVHGWNKYNWKCLDKLWQLESGWNELAHNRRTGAYGIPQALPGKKMAAMGKNWKSNPEVQIKWGASYIKSRYKSPCKALAFMERRGWY